MTLMLGFREPNTGNRMNVVDTRTVSGTTNTTANVGHELDANSTERQLFTSRLGPLLVQLI